MSVSLSNVHLDDVFDAEIRLDRAYREIRFLNCSGKLDGDRVTIDHIPPYGFAAFEVMLRSMENDSIAEGDDFQLSIVHSKIAPLN